MSERFVTVLKRLGPKGRLFRIFFGSEFEKFYKAAACAPERVAQWNEKVRDAGIPGRIPEEALDDWEEFLNLPKKPGLTVAQRNARILGKYNQPGGQGPGYIQDVLQQAGFPLYVYENRRDQAKTYTSNLGSFTLGSASIGAYTDRIDPRTLNGRLYAGPARYTNTKDYTPSTLGTNTLGGFSLGEFSRTLIEEVEYIIGADSSKYIYFFFLAGPNGIYDFVDIPAEREDDLERLIYEIKPAEAWCIAQINLV